MSEAALTSLERALKRMRDREAFALGWRVIHCTAYDGSEESFYYTQGQRTPNYPVPTIRYQIAIQSKGIAVINLSESTIDCVITERNHIVYDH